MYCDFYELTERPFNVTPDPKFLYLNARYREAIASLNYGITQRKGFITLIGEAGTGKTTLLKKLLEDLDQKTKTVFIFNTNVSFEEILEYIFSEFDLPVHNGKKLYMLQRLNTFLLDELRNGGNVALLIDEAQDLEFSVLEDLRLLSNLETAKEKILQIVLSGQPELGQKLSNPVLRQLRQRIGINCRLLPLSRDEVTEYINYRLQAAGSPDLKLFTREAEDQIYHLSRGIPRLVNVVCDNSLVIGYALGKKRIGADIVAEAAADLLPAEPASEQAAHEPMIVTAPPPTGVPPRRDRRRTRYGVGAVLVAALAVGLWSAGRTALEQAAPESPDSIPGQREVIRPGSLPRDGVTEAVQPKRPQEQQPEGRLAMMSDPIKPAADSAWPAERDSVKDVVEPATGAALPVAAAPAAEAWEAAPASDVVAPQENAGEKPLPTAADLADLPTTSVVAAVPKEEAKYRAAAAGGAEWDTTAPPPGEASAAEPVPSGIQLSGAKYESLVVRDGDSLSGIARRKYGQSSYTVLDLLKLANPVISDVDVLVTGQVVRIPQFDQGFPILTEDGKSSLLVFSTPNQTRARNLSNALESRGYRGSVVPVRLGAQKRVYRVVVTGEGSDNEIDVIGRELQQLFRDDTAIAKLGE